MKSTLTFFMIILALAITATANAEAVSPIDLALARQYFDDLKNTSDTDAGKLWGVRLYGPTFFVDPDSRFMVANQADKDGRLKAEDGVFIGTLEPSVNIANSSLEWSGTDWTIVNWNSLSPTDPYDRMRLLVHESWHRVQDEIGFPSATSSNVYLDDKDGRIYLLLEFRALSKALMAKDSSTQAEAIGDALTFRMYRQSLHPGNNENAFERHEGMAEYTGLKLCGLPDSLLCIIAAKKLQLGEQSSGLANSFAYLTGPALGLLLDRLSPGWRIKVREGVDLPDLLASSINWKKPDNAQQLKAAVDATGGKYNASELFAAESIRSLRQDQAYEAFKDRLQTDGRLIIPNNNLKFGFNPDENLVAFDTTGVIYKTLRLSGDFGILEADSGIVRENNWQYFMAVAPAPDKIAGDTLVWPGYRLILNPGWKIELKKPRIYIIANK